MIGNNSVTDGRKWFSQHRLLSLEINSCLKTNIGNVYAKVQEDIYKTGKDNVWKPQRGRQTEMGFIKTVTVALTFGLVTSKSIGV